VWTGFLLGIAVLIAFAMPSYRQGGASIAGKTAKDFALEVDGKPAKLSDLRGKVVVLNFWASWCAPSLDETPALIRLQQRLAAHDGLVLGVSADEDPAKYARFVREQGVTFPTWRDPSVKGTTSQVALDYGTSVYPETYVIDRRGKIVRKIVGE